MTSRTADVIERLDHIITQIQDTQAVLETLEKEFAQVADVELIASYHDECRR